MGATAFGPYAPPPPGPEEELRSLREEAETLAGFQERIARRIQQLEKQD